MYETQSQLHELKCKCEISKPTNDFQNHDDLSSLEDVFSIQILLDLKHS